MADQNRASAFTRHPSSFDRSYRNVDGYGMRDKRKQALSAKRRTSSFATR